MQRYFISIENRNNDIINISGEDVHHLKNVMRSSVGDQLICCDGQGVDYLVEITKRSSTQIECRIVEKYASRGEPATKITIAQSLPKREKFEWVLQKGTEMGAVHFLPFVSERTVVKLDEKKVKQKVTRWKTIVKEAAEQAHRGVIPEVDSPRSWEELLHTIQQAEVALIAYEKGGEALSESLVSNSSQDILVIIGPEGGFTEKEVTEAKEYGAIPVSLGPRILRTETAPLVFLSSILYHSGDI